MVHRTVAALWEGRRFYSRPNAALSRAAATVPGKRTTCGGSRLDLPLQVRAFALGRRDFELQEPVQLLDARRVPHFAQGFGLNLTNALARDPELLADFLQRACAAVSQPKSKFEDFP